VKSGMPFPTGRGSRTSVRLMTVMSRHTELSTYNVAGPKYFAGFSIVLSLLRMTERKPSFRSLLTWEVRARCPFARD
jgi:hypothetical protein